MVNREGDPPKAALADLVASAGAQARIVDGTLPEPGAKILAGEKEEKEVGEITSSAILPLPGGDRPVALGYLRREAAEKDLRAGTAKLKLASLPLA